MNKKTNLFVPLASIPLIGCGLYYYYFYIYKKRQLVFLQDPNAKYIAYLKSIEDITHDTKRFRFSLPSTEHFLGLNTGQHLYLNADIDGKKVVRPYTPTTLQDTKGYFDLVMKVYRRNENPKFPDGGKMSQHVEGLKIGEGIEIRGPSGRLKYIGNDDFTIKRNYKDKDDIPPRKVKANRIGMIAGGTGITPMYQLIQEILLHPTPGNKDIKFDLIFANQTENDILLKDELETLARKFPDRLTVWYTVDKLAQTDKDKWPYDIGYVTADMIAKHLPPPPPVTQTTKDSSNLEGQEQLGTLILGCGPPPMIKLAVTPALTKLGYNEANIFFY